MTFGGLLLLAGRLGDLFGRKRVFLFGLSLFTVASALCGLSESRELLIGARFLQGIGAAFSCSMVLGILVRIFPDAAGRNRAMGTYALVANIGGSIGLLIGGVLTQELSWHWIFFINVSIGVVGVLLASNLLEDEAGIGVLERVDWAGGLLVVAAPTLAIWAIVNASRDGWPSPRTLASLFGALALAVVFVLVEGRVQQPLLPLGRLASKSLGAANLVRLCLGFGLSIVLFYGALYLQNVLHFSAIRTGFAYFPVNLVIGVGSLLFVSRIIRVVGPSRPMRPGFGLLALSLLLLGRAPVHGSYLTDVMPAFLLVGVGASLVALPSVTIAMSGAGPNESGLGADERQPADRRRLRYRGRGQPL